MATGNYNGPEHNGDWLAVSELRACLGGDDFEKDEIYDYAVMLLEWAISKRACTPNEAMIQIMTTAPETAVNGGDLFRRIAKFFTDWSGRDENGETMPVNAADLRTIIELRHDAFYRGRRYDELVESLRPAVIYEEDLRRGEYEAVWLEDVDRDEIVPALVSGMSVGTQQARMCLVLDDGSIIYPLLAEYNRRWRAWTSRPDSATRRPRKWENR